jgi:integrase
MRVDAIKTGVVKGIRFRGNDYTQVACLQTLGRILRWASEERGYIQGAPRIKYPKLHDRDVRLTPVMQDRLLAHMSRDCADVFQLMHDAFLRTSEALAMRWDNVHLGEEEPYYFVPDGKTSNARRKVPLSDRAIQILLDRKKMAKDDWVFPSRLKRSSGPRSTIAKQFRKAREAAGIPKHIRLYDARHEAASSYLEHSNDLSTLKAVMGHASISTTNKYLHGTTTKAADVVNERNRFSLRIVKKRA